MDMKRSYYEDLRLFDTLPKGLWIGTVALALVIAPFFLDNYQLYVMGYVAINVIVALGLNVLVGYTGQISLGHAGFFAIGAYATVLLTNAGLPILVAIPCAGLIGAAFGFLLGLPALRLEGPYLAVVTLGFGLTVETVFAKASVFGGATGPAVPPFTVRFLPDFSSEQNLYVLIMLTTGLSLLAVRNLIRTRVGRAFIAIRDSDVAASCAGVDLTYYKTLAFAVSAFFTGIGGGLFAFHLGQVDPTTFNLMLSILFLAMVVIGGVGSILGAILGAVTISLLNLKLKGLKMADFEQIPLAGQEIAEFLGRHFMETGMANIQFIVYGVILVMIMLFEPLGLYGLWIRVKRYWRTWPL
ncbi:MAG: branched-chain amino acid ABC transporter permease [Proteobacteria bacterium]|nr:MAG: branched-chain amino acid ABC transporter permease [Pseudomonadota bacterium]QKK11531.1 MAG: branched-chain amino acid ABC transporter permease [Pseudomonadota bacterium]